uniref:HMG box domain-containing protein n=1 Tax=Sinocyclocheilus grahami TaxID=75366 RepID=A0A672KIS0_SINGR
MSAYMLWLNASRERIKSENPGISVTEISKKAGEMWKQLSKDRKENILLCECEHAICQKEQSFCS